MSTSPPRTAAGQVLRGLLVEAIHGLYDMKEPGHVFGDFALLGKLVNLLWKLFVLDEEDRVLAGIFLSNEGEYSNPECIALPALSPEEASPQVSAKQQ